MLFTDDSNLPDACKCLDGVAMVAYSVIAATLLTLRQREQHSCARVALEHAPVHHDFQKYHQSISKAHVKEIQNLALLRYTRQA